MKLLYIIPLLLLVCGVSVAENYDSENHSKEYDCLAYALMCDSPSRFSEKNVAEIILLHSGDDKALQEEAKDTLIKEMGSIGEEIKLPNDWKRSNRKYPKEEK